MNNFIFLFFLNKTGYHFILQDIICTNFKSLDQDLPIQSQVLSVLKVINCFEFVHIIVLKFRQINFKTIMLKNSKQFMTFKTDNT